MIPAAERDATEPPTPKRLEEARRAGDVPASRDVTALAAMLVGTGVLAATAGTSASGLAAFARRAWGGSGGAPVELIQDGAHAAARILAPVLLAAFSIALAVGVLQTRGLFAPQALGPRLRMRLAASPWECVRGSVLVVGIAAVVGWMLPGLLRDLVDLHRAGPGQLLAKLVASMTKLAGPILGVIAAVAVADLAYRHWAWRRRQRMSRAEVRREQRESEGDPWIAEERRRIHRGLSDPGAS